MTETERKQAQNLGYRIDTVTGHWVCPIDGGLVIRPMLHSDWHRLEATK